MNVNHKGQEEYTTATKLRILCTAFVSFVLPLNAAGAQETRIPNFAPTAGVAWQSDTREGLAPAMHGPRPPEIDATYFEAKGHDYDMDTDFPVMNVSNSNFLPWVADALTRQNDRILAGLPVQPKSAACWPHGLPAYMRFNGPTFIVQTADEVVILKNQSNEIRRIRLNQNHSAAPKPSWYGESVGHYENGDTLVVDTVGFNDRTHVDLFRTPHTTQLHVTERWTLIEGGQEILLSVRVEDSGAFKQPYELTKHYRRVNASFQEAVCAENPIGPLQQGIEPMPEDNIPDF
jgi:hypothetical protein